MLLDRIKKFNLILASKSPRRHQLMKEAGFEFVVRVPDLLAENFPGSLDKFKIPVYLAELKSKAYSEKLAEKDILISADTIVWFDNQVLNKPSGREQALEFLQQLSGNMHEVITGVCLRGKDKSRTFYSYSRVFFSELTREEIEYYVDVFKPYDKAGAYGIQEWIGYIGIKAIEGSFFNVMGLPVQQLYHQLSEFIRD